MNKKEICKKKRKNKKRLPFQEAQDRDGWDVLLVVKWALRDSNPRPSACKADALNQLS